MTIAFITTVFNEEENIENFLDSFFLQTEFPDEFIIVDGGSTDKTIQLINGYKSKFKKLNIRYRLIIKRGNRSVGRNEAIKNSNGEIIICSDSGCILDRDWIKNIIKPFDNINIDVVAGYYRGLSKNIFQKCLIPYALVMPDNVDSKNFLPATRSMGFRKAIWEKVKGFPEEYSNNEDYVFAKNIKNLNARIYFQKSAFVFWIPRNNLIEAAVMFFRFSLGDSEARILRPKVVLIFIRYIIGMILLILFFITRLHFILFCLYFILVLYIFWSVAKNYKYVLDLRAIVILPILQLTSDIAIIAGTVMGLLKYGI